MEDTDTIAVTIKNYNLEKGLSKRFFEEIPQTFEISGLYGRGLMINNNSKGVHFAFAAGTGVLVFIDLVAKLLLQSVAAFPGVDRLNPLFKFVLFASFESRENGIALELLEGLKELQKQLSLNTFDLELRFSDQKSKRWDKDFIIEKIKSHESLYKKKANFPNNDIESASKTEIE